MNSTKESRAFMCSSFFKAPSEFIKRLENYYRLQDTVVKFMIIKLGKKDLAALQNKAARQEAAASQ